MIHYFVGRSILRRGEPLFVVARAERGGSWEARAMFLSCQLVEPLGAGVSVDIWCDAEGPCYFSLDTATIEPGAYELTLTAGTETSVLAPNITVLEPHVYDSVYPDENDAFGDDEEELTIGSIRSYLDGLVKDYVAPIDFLRRADPHVRSRAEAAPSRFLLLPYDVVLERAPQRMVTVLERLIYEASYLMAGGANGFTLTVHRYESALGLAVGLTATAQARRALPAPSNGLDITVVDDEITLSMSVPLTTYPRTAESRSQARPQSLVLDYGDHLDAIRTVERDSALNPQAASNYQWDVFVSCSLPDDDSARWVGGLFFPLLKRRVEEGLKNPRPISIFLEAGLGRNTNQNDVSSSSILAQSRVIVPLLSHAFLMSRTCMNEYNAMLGREAFLRARGEWSVPLIHPVIVHGTQSDFEALGDVRASAPLEIQNFYCVTAASHDYDRLKAVLEHFAVRVANAIDHAPSFEPALWQEVTSRRDQQHAAFPFQKKRPVPLPRMIVQLAASSRQSSIRGEFMVGAKMTGEKSRV